MVRTYRISSLNFLSIYIIQQCLLCCIPQFSCSVVSDSLWPHEMQHARPSCPSNSQSFPKLMSIESVMPSNHLILCHPLLLLPSIFHSIKVWLCIFCVFNKFEILVQCSVQFSSVTQSYPTFCDPMDWSKPDFPVHHQLPKFTQTHVHWVGDAIQPSHPLSSSSPPAWS